MRDLALAAFGPPPRPRRLFAPSKATGGRGHAAIRPRQACPPPPGREAASRSGTRADVTAAAVDDRRSRCGGGRGERFCKTSRPVSGLAAAGGGSLGPARPSLASRRPDAGTVPRPARWREMSWAVARRPSEASASHAADGGPALGPALGPARSRADRPDRIGATLGPSRGSVGGSGRAKSGPMRPARPASSDGLGISGGGSHRPARAGGRSLGADRCDRATRPAGRRTVPRPARPGRARLVVELGRFLPARDRGRCAPARGRPFGGRRDVGRVGPRGPARRGEHRCPARRRACVGARLLPEAPVGQGAVRGTRVSVPPAASAGDGP